MSVSSKFSSRLNFKAYFYQTLIVLETRKEMLSCWMSSYSGKNVSGTRGSRLKRKIVRHFSAREVEVCFALASKMGILVNGVQYECQQRSQCRLLLSPVPLTKTLLYKLFHEISNERRPNVLKAEKLDARTCLVRRDR